MNILGYLSRELSIDKEQLLKFILSSPYRYKKYEIPKRNGKGNRTIAQPSKELKFLQRSVCKKFLTELPIHPSATAYRKGKSIKDNASIHAGSKYLLKMDFKDFFPSIKPNDFISHTTKYIDNNITEEDKVVIERLFFFGRVRGAPLELSIGSPTSPLISNTVMYDFDKEISNICNQHRVLYTRYADDVAFSTNQKDALFNYPMILGNVINNMAYPKLAVNEAKTVFLSRKGNIHLTGLVLTPDGKISVGRGNKRYIKSLIHRSITGNIEADEKLYLSGYLSFCYDVEPTFIDSLKNKYGDDAMDRLMGKIG